MNINTIHSSYIRLLEIKQKSMKTARMIISGILILLSWSVVAQIDPDHQAGILHISLKSESNQPLPSAVIRLTDRATNTFRTVMSDAAGKIVIPVVPGHEYLVTDHEGSVLKEIRIPEKLTTPLVKTIHLKEPLEHAEIPYDTVDQGIGTFSLKGNLLEGLVTIRIRDVNGVSIKNCPVRLVCPKYRRVLKSTTNASGVVRFQVLLYGDYHLGILESDNVKTLRIPGFSGYTLNAEIAYQPTDITEWSRNDTVHQDLIPRKGATSLRAFLEVTVKDYQQLPLSDEAVYLDVVGKSMVYTTATNDQGKAYFLLPYGQDYTLHLTYERDIYLYRYPEKKGYLLEDEAFITYRGTAQIEDFFIKARRDKNGFITEFMPVKVKKIGFDPSNVIQTEHGYHVNFPSKTETPTPAVFNNDDVIQGGGYYSKEVYSFNNRTGQFNWGLKLGDNGVSASVCDADFLIITTESCTLYAIDARTGELAWSKWLGPEINSTPTIADGKVYAVYPTELGNRVKGTKPYAVICFELKTGTILWQNWIDSEPLGSPVASGQSVFITSSKGNLHQFNNTSGVLQGTLTDGDFTSPPTISGDIVYLTRKSAEKPGEEQIEAYHANSLLPSGSFPAIKNQSGVSISRLTPSELMNYSGGRPLFFRGKLYAVSGKSLICFDPGRFSSEWIIDLSKVAGMEEEEFVSMPVAVNQKIIASTRSGKVLVVDPRKGVIETIYDLEVPVTFQPVIHAGWIYAGSKEGKLISYNTGNPALTGWPMWTLNATHNPVVE